MTVQDITDQMDKEEGTAYSPQDLLFQDFSDGEVFVYDDLEDRQIKSMLKRDGKANTLERVLTLPIRSAPINLSKERSEEEVYDFVHNVLFEPESSGGMSTPLPGVIAQMAQAVGWRKAYFERVWTEKTLGGTSRAVYDKVAWRPPQTCRVLRDKQKGSFQGFAQMPITEGEEKEKKFKPIRSFVYIHGQHRDPLNGVSDLEIAYWCFQTKQKIRFLWYSFLEGQALPKTVAQAKNLADARKAANELIKLRSGGVVGLDDQVTWGVLESSGRGASQFKEALQWLDSEASNSVLAGFTDLGATAAGGTGSFALSKDQTDFFLMSRQAVAQEMQDTINAFLIPDLVFYNFGPDAKAPKFEFGPIAEDDASQAITLLQAIGVNQSPVLPQEFYDELIERVAGFLGLNTQTVREGLDKVDLQARAAAARSSNNPAAPNIAGPAAAIDAAAQAVARRQIRVVPPTNATA